MTTTWLVIADSARARILSYSSGNELQEVAELLHPASRSHEREMVTDRGGRVFDRQGPGRHAMSENVSPKQHEAWKLCNELAAELDTARAKNLFDRLVLVAAPSFLGGLRKALPAPTLRTVVCELDQDLVKFDVNQIREHLPPDALDYSESSKHRHQGG